MAGSLEQKAADKIANIFADSRLNEYYLANQVASRMDLESEIRMLRFLEEYKVVSYNNSMAGQVAIDLSEYDE